MRVIWKYRLDLTEAQTIMTPYNFKPLCVQVQKGKPCLWAVVDESACQGVRFPRRIRIVGTGDPLGHTLFGAYLSTFQLEDDELVFHVFIDAHPEAGVSTHE